MTSQHVTIIAEIGENHLGNLDIARKMIEEAAKAGADIVKFQSYRGRDVREDDPERDWFCRVELSDAAHRELKAHADQHGIEFLSSPFTVERAQFLCEELGLQKLKIASSELLNAALLDYVNGRAREVFLSTGLATLEEVGQAISRLSRVENTTLLHCVTQYPTEDCEANLRAISTLAEAFPGHGVGYSDHTIGIEGAIVSAALGAVVVEKHFTLAKMLPGTDHALSATPEELAELVRQVRRVEVLLGSGVKVPSPRELAVRDFVRTRWQGA